MRTTITLIVLLGLLGASVGVALWVWDEIGQVTIGMHGLIAIGLGAALTLLLGGGLMALMFFSARHGYDERAHEGERTRPPKED